MKKSARPSRGHSLFGIFAVPVILAVVSIVGLLSALIGDDTWNMVSWATLSVPIALIGWLTWAERINANRQSRNR